MRTTLPIDDKPFAEAVELAAPGKEKSELIRECVKVFIQRQTARRLAALGGQAPEIEQARRRREEAPTSSTCSSTPAQGSATSINVTSTS